MPPSGTHRAFVLSNFLTLRSLIRSPAVRTHNPLTEAIAQSAKLALLTLFTLLLLGTFTQSVQAQQPVIHYIYDDLGRLVGVVDQNGDAATYTYDAVGNILAIGRHNVADTPGPVAITLVAPSKGKIGTAVSIFGRGFSPDPAQNTVGFSGAIATVTAATTNSLTTSVPPGALTGPITVTAPLGMATSPEPFTVLGVVIVSPPSAVLFPTQTQQFTATVDGTSTPAVTWSVDGVVGGNATLGTISSTGLYTAPAAVPSPPTLAVRATNTDDPSFSDSATVVIVALPDKIFAHLVSLGFAAPTTITVNSLTARPISVSVATPPSTTVNALTAPAVSVGFAAPTAQTAFLTASPVGVTLQPVITSVTPSSGARGVAGLSLLLTGAGFAGATSVSFQLNGSNDVNLSATGITVGPDGTQATFTLAIASGAAPGPRVVRITTPSDASTAVGTGSNLFTVQ